MGRRKSIIAWALAAAAALAVAVLAGAALLPRLIGLESVRNRILAEASRRTGGSASAARIDFAVFPRPHAIVHGASLAIPGTLRGTSESLVVYPEIWPLFAGTVRIARIDARAPAINAVLPPRPPGPAARRSLEQIESAAASVLNDLSAKLPGLDVSVSAGRLELVEGGKTVVSIRDLEGRVKFPPDALAVRLTCRSDLFDRLSATATLDPRTFKGRGTIEVARLRPRPLAAWLIPGETLPGAGSAGDVAVTARAGGIGVLEADVAGSAPSLDLSRGDRRRTLTSLRFAGTVRQERGATTVSVRELTLGSPRLAVAGQLLLDPAARRAEVDAAIRDADLSSLRDAAIALAGDAPALRRFFDVARGGRLPSAEIRIRAATPREMGKPENIVASLRLEDGRVHVPGPDLDLVSAAGEVSIARGILEGRRLSARLGRSRGRDGSLTLGLAGKSRVFRLDTTVHADLSELPPLLSRLVGAGAFRDELSRIEDVRGEAEGRLILGDTTAAVRTRFDASEVRLSGRTRRMPFPVAISRGRVSFDGETLAVREMAGTVGANSASGLAARLKLGAEPAIDELTGTFSLSLGELYPWLASLAEGGEVIDGIESLDGSADLSVVRLAGPLAGPGRWQYAVSGDVKGLVAVAHGVPRPVEIDRGSFRATPGELSFTGVRGRLLDAPLSVSGNLRGGPGTNIRDRAYDLSIDGQVGPDAALWVSDLIRLPPRLRIRAPVSLSRGRLSRNAAGRTAFSGTLGFPGGPLAALDVRKDAGGLAVDNLAVRDAGSDAVIALRLGPDAVSAAFSGTLTHDTVARVLSESAVRGGRLSGDFRAEIRRDRPADSSARGTLDGRGIVIPLAGGNSLAIETIALQANGNAVRITRSTVTWMEQQLSLTGEVGLVAGGVRVDLDLASDRIDADKIIAGLAPTVRAGPQADALPGVAAGGEEAPRDGVLYTVPVSGDVRLRAGSLHSGRLAWSPFDAGIALSPERVTVTVTDASVCGIAMPGTLAIAPRDVSVDFNLSAENGRIDPALACLTGRKYGATGRFTFRAHVSGRGAPGAIVRSLNGDFAFEAVKGRIHRLNLLSKILAIVNVTELFRGRFPDLGKDGFAYNAIKARGTLENGKVVIRDGASLDGASMGIVAHGTVDLGDRNVDMVALVAPLRTIDAIIRRIPLVGYILGGSLVSIPVAITGDFDDPKISILPPSQIAAGTLGILERILKAPVKLIER